MDLAGGSRGDIAAAVVVARSEDLLVAEISQIGWRGRLGGTVAVTVEHVHAENSLGGHGGGKKGDGSERLGQHLDTVDCWRATARELAKKEQNGWKICRLLI